jgi:hypothetical protein
MNIHDENWQGDRLEALVLNADVTYIASYQCRIIMVAIATSTEHTSRTDRRGNR